MLDKVRALLAGKKTYIIAIILAVIAIVTGQPVEGTEDAFKGINPETSTTVLLAAGLATLRAAISKIGK